MEEKALVVSENGGSEKPSYRSAAAKVYRRAAIFLLCVLILFTVFSLLFFSGSFRSDGIYSFATDVRTVASSVRSGNTDIRFTESEGDRSAFSLRAGVVSVGSTGFEVFGTGGERISRVERSYDSPRAAYGENHYLAYGFASREFSLCNAYGELFHGEADEEIYAADVSDNGTFLLVTKDSAGGSQVLLHGVSGKLKERLTRASATADVSLNASGKRFAVLGLGFRDGDVGTILDVYDAGGERPRAALSFSGEMPLAVGFLNGRNLAVLTDKAIRVVTYEGKLLLASYFEEEETPAAISFSEKGFALALKKSELPAANEVSLYSQKGKLLREEKISGFVTDVCLRGDTLAALTDGAAYVIPKKGEYREIPVGSGAIGTSLLPEDEILVYYRNKAEWVG